MTTDKVSILRLADERAERAREARAKARSEWRQSSDWRKRRAVKLCELGYGVNTLVMHGYPKHDAKRLVLGEE